MAEKSEISSGKIQDDAIIIREARPVLEEGLVFAQFFDEASEGFFKVASCVHKDGERALMGNSSSYLITNYGTNH